MKNIFRQCELTNGDITTVGWIEATKAMEGKFTTLDDDPTVWKITKVYEGTMSKEEVNARSRDWKNQRKASDI